MFCQHRNIGVHSVKGLVTCPDCFRLVRHPWYQSTAKEPSSNVETGIERINRLCEENGKEQVMAAAKQEAELQKRMNYASEANRLRGRALGIRL